MWPKKIEATVDLQHTHALDGASVAELKVMLAEIRRARALQEGRVIEGEAAEVEESRLLEGR